MLHLSETFGIISVADEGEALYFMSRSAIGTVRLHVVSSFHAIDSRGAVSKPHEKER